MEAKKVSTQIIDHVDGQPSIVLSNGNWGVFDPKTNMYKDTGIKASPEDDSSAVKYYKLGNETTPPEAPSQTGGWSTLASLNASLASAGWAEDPLQTASNNRFCWIATYGKENIVDTVATEAQGHLVFKPKFTRTNVRLWSNYANSPTISVVGNEIIITNPDGTVIKQKFASTEAINDLTTLINSLQSQVDGAIYSYSMEGVPTLNTLPTTDWRLDSSGSPITDPATIADIYKTHVGDTYTDLLTYRSYRFSQTGASSSDPASYEWKIIEDDALSAALGEIAKLGREKITVFTAQPTVPYKKGDMWLDGEVMLHAIQSSEVFNLEHWVQPYATKAELSVIEADLQQAAGDAHSAKQNLATLEANLTNMTGTVADAIKDNIISDTELMDLTSELRQLDIDQETLLTTVNYLLASTYLPVTPKDTLQTRSNNSIAAGGSMDIYQAQISTMITDRVITAQERADYLSKFNTYKNHLKLLNEAISGASSAIEGELKRLADEKVDNIEIGGRNYLTYEYLSSRYSHIVEWGGVFTGLSGLQAPPNNDLLELFAKGEQLTFRCYIVNEGETPVNVHIGWYGDPAGGNRQHRTNQIAPGNEGWAAVTFTSSDYNPDNVTIRGEAVTGISKATFSKLKLEKGTIPTDWSPAPEDVQANIDNAVIKATYWSIKSSSPVIYKDSNSATASGVHTAVTVNGELRSGTTTTQGGFISLQPNGGVESTATASPRTIAPTDIEGKTSYTVRLYEKADKVTLLDTMTIPVVFKGASGINVAMSNEADVLPASPTGVVTDYADTGNVIRVFEGASELAYTKPTSAIVKGAAVDISTKNVQNLVVNGDFRNKLSGWTLASSASINNGRLKIVANNNIPYPTYDLGTNAGEKCYISFIGQRESGAGCSFMNGNFNELPITSPVPIKHSIVYSANSGFIRFGTLGAPSTFVLFIDDLICINLTSLFGAGNEPTKEECDKIFGGYFEGTAPLPDVSLGGNGTYQVYPSPTGISEGSKSISGLACSFANASNMTTDSAKIVFTISGKTSDGTSFSFDKIQNFSKSKIGADGADGKGIVSIKEFYAVSASSTTEPTSWSETVLQMTAANKYLWNYEEITYTTGAPTNSKKKVIGVFGDKGGDGKGVASIKNYYLASSLSTGITRETSGWTEAIQMISPTEKYLWNYETITYTTGSPTNTDPVVIGTYGEQGNDGIDGEGGINVIVTRQGSFRTYWRQIGDQGQILTAPEKVSEIIGGVEIGGVKYVQCKVIIYKGSVDVTASALAAPTTLPKWYLNNVLMGSVTDTLNIPITYADGKDDEVRFEYTDTNAKNWKGV